MLSYIIDVFSTRKNNKLFPFERDFNTNVPLDYRANAGKETNNFLTETI